MITNQQCTIDITEHRSPSEIFSAKMMYFDFARFRVNQHPSLLDLTFVQFPHRIFLMSVHPPLCKSDHAVLCWIYTSALPRLPPRPDKINPAIINVQTIATLALQCRWEFPEDYSLNEVWTSLRDQISLLTSKATPPSKAYKRPLHKPYYTRRVKRAIQRRRLDSLVEFRE